MPSKPLKIGVIGPAGLGGSHIAVELVNRGHHVVGYSRHPERLGSNKLYTPHALNLETATIEEQAAAYKGLDVLVNAYGPHSGSPGAGAYMPFLEATRRIVLGAKVAHVGYFIMIGGTASLHMPGLGSLNVLDYPPFWEAYSRGIADSEAHTAYMETRMGKSPMAGRFRAYRNARIALHEGKETAETKATIEELEGNMRNAAMQEFVTACRTTYMFFEGSTDFEWSFVSPSALYHPGTRTGKYEVSVDVLPLKGDKGSSEGLEGRMEGISSADLAVAVADEAETRKNKSKHWSPYADISDDKPAAIFASLD